MMNTKTISEITAPMVLCSPIATPTPIIHAAAANAKNNNGHLICVIDYLPHLSIIYRKHSVSIIVVV